MTIRVLRSTRAAAEIREITTYLEEHSQPAAQRFLEALERAEQQLSQFPNSGAPGPLPGTRRLIVGNYVVSYRRRGSDVEIFAVRHARRRDARVLTYLSTEVFKSLSAHSPVPSIPVARRIAHSQGGGQN